ncbi:MAG: DNA-directed RNA polymerase subunit beta [Paenibacillaceae bacterium]|jgi:hypothetical protein|nr:DNA-directed RNA polymerase subunit beta [Paenibacillaceae bacterium]
MGSSSARTRRRAPKRSIRWMWRTFRLLFAIGLFAMGLYVGYVLLGGGEAQDVLQWKTWKHIYDLVWADQ